MMNSSQAITLSKFINAIRLHSYMQQTAHFVSIPYLTLPFLPFPFNSSARFQLSPTSPTILRCIPISSKTKKYSKD